MFVTVSFVGVLEEHAGFADTWMRGEVPESPMIMYLEGLQVTTNLKVL